MAAAPAVETANGYLHPPTDAETLQLYEPATEHEEEVNEHILNHPLAVSLRAQPGMVESRPHMRIPAGMRPHNLTAGVLAGEGRIEVPPLSFNDNDAELPSMIQLMHFGKDVCGHPGLVHGGMLATMLDEGLARACFPVLPNKIGVTASLKIDYRVPCPAGSYVVLKAYTQKVEGRKAWVKGWIELLGEEEGTGTKVVEAEALFIVSVSTTYTLGGISRDTTSRLGLALSSPKSGITRNFREGDVSVRDDTNGCNRSRRMQDSW